MPVMNALEYYLLSSGINNPNATQQFMDLLNNYMANNPTLSQDQAAIKLATSMGLGFNPLQDLGDVALPVATPQPTTTPVTTQTRNPTNTMYALSNNGSIAYQLINGAWQEVTDPTLYRLIKASIQPGSTGYLTGAGAETPIAPIGNFNLAGGGTAMANTTGSIWDLTENMYDPFTAYLESLGLGGKNYLTPAQNYQLGLYDPLSTLLGIQGRMGAVSGFGQYAPSSGYLASYAQPYVSNPSNMYAQARNVLAGIMGANPEQRAMMGTGYEPIYSGGELTSRSGVDEMQDLLKLALRERLGTVGSKWVSQRLPAEQQMWANYQAGGGTSPFWDYLRQKYNLYG